jgi:hypothetical protein
MCSEASTALRITQNSVPVQPSNNLNLEFLIRVEFPNAIRKFSLNVSVIANPKFNTKKITRALT